MFSSNLLNASSTIGSRSPVKAGTIQNMIGIFGKTLCSMTRARDSRQTIGRVVLEVRINAASFFVL